MIVNSDDDLGEGMYDNEIFNSEEMTSWED